MLTSLAPAKVNLTLHVGPAKADGRHPLDSLVVFAGPEAADRVTVEPAKTLSLGVIGPMADMCGPVGDNLVLRAADALRTILGVSEGAQITLVKHLPAAAGIGGGSADAGAALRILNKLWGGPQETDAHLLALAAHLGGDVPVAVKSQTMRMQGEGERLSPVTLPSALPALLVNPGCACPTGPVFRRFDDMPEEKTFHEPPLAHFDTIEALYHWLETETYNDLEAPALSLVTEIAHTLEMLRALPEQRLVRMSGSGATCFALFDTFDGAERARDQISAARPDMWVRATRFGAALP